MKLALYLGAALVAAPDAKAEDWTDTDRAAWTAVYDLIGKLAASEPEHTMPTTYQPTGEPAVAKYRGVGVDGHMVTDIAIFKTDGVTPMAAADGVGAARSYCVGEIGRPADCISSSGKKFTITMSDSGPPRSAASAPAPTASQWLKKFNKK